MTTRARSIVIARRVADGALLTLFALVAVGLVLGRVMPMTGHPTAIIRGGSMSPTISLGSAIVLQPVSASQLAPGDIVTMRVGPRQSIFTHRIVQLLTLDGIPFIETKGDANAAPDGATVPVSAVIGRVVWWIPLAGFLLALLSVPIGVVFVLGLGLTLGTVAFLLAGIEPDLTGQVGDGAIAATGRVRSGPVAATGPVAVGTPAPAVARPVARPVARRVPRQRRTARQSS